jgi:predicted RNase H-like nuclease
LASYLGFDGFRGGWVAASIDDDGSHFFDYSPRLARLVSGRFKRAMIDIPIGLPDTGYRQCDIEARAILGPSVFLGARRSLLTFVCFDQANNYYWNSEGKGRGISQQLWNIRDKIKEVDDFVTPASQSIFSESHPEAVFHRLNGKKSLAPKHSEGGRQQRLKILETAGFTKVASWLGLRFGTKIGRDDLIDACACAVAARDSHSAFGGIDCDARCLRMKINY